MNVLKRLSAIGDYVWLPLLVLGGIAAWNFLHIGRLDVLQNSERIERIEKDKLLDGSWRAGDMSRWAAALQESNPSLIVPKVEPKEDE